MNLFLSSLFLLFTIHKNFRPLQRNSVNLLTSSTRTNAQKDYSFDRTSSSSVEVFARFSPLIGGVAIFPIHVEIMLLLTDDFHGTHGSKNSASLNTTNTTNKKAILHRIDFVPQNPQSAETILQLLSLQDVPGVIRHRILAVGMEPHEDGNLLTSVSTDRLNSLLETKVSKLTTSIVVPLGKVLLDQQNQGGGRMMTTNNMSSIRDIIESVEDKNGSKLHLIRNNCYSFAFNILSNLNVTSI
jgi:hypothetical protein